jgi:hypothetical protein
MAGVRNLFMATAIASIPVLVAGSEAKAQAAAASASSAAASSAYGGGMGMGMGMMPMMYAMNPSASLSPTDAAALGMQGQGNGGMGVNGMNNIFRNPMAAPYMFGNVNPMGPTSAATMMLAGPGLMGIGSGQLSGVRPGAGAGRGRTQQPAAKSRGTASTPGGLAGRYFNRTARIVRYPQSYYNRQNRYYPQVTH